MDQANEDNIQATIEQLANEVTCIIVAHRLTTVENYDFIIWLDKGHIVMQGDTAEILMQYRKSLRKNVTEEEESDGI